MCDSDILAMAMAYYIFNIFMGFIVVLIPCLAMSWINFHCFKIQTLFQMFITDLHGFWVMLVLV
jgi:hypothetical protein